MSTASLVLAAAVLVLAVYLQPTRHELALLGQACSEVGSSTAQVNHSTDASCYFHATYRDARAAFRRLATSAGADEQHVLAVDAAADLTVDVAVFQGTGASASRTVVHLSGVHGVEGHCGSSIQLAWLDKRRATKARAEAEGAAAAGDAPTVILVHVVNPFGMANGRRFNENNVDLNRNFVLDEATWAELLARPPSFGGYAAAYSLFNENADPRLNVVSRNAVYWFITLRDVYLAGFETIKKAFVVGQCVGCCCSCCCCVLVAASLFLCCCTCTPAAALSPVARVRRRPPFLHPPSLTPPPKGTTTPTRCTSEAPSWRSRWCCCATSSRRRARSPSRPRWP